MSLGHPAGQDEKVGRHARIGLNLKALINIRGCLRTMISVNADKYLQVITSVTMDQPPAARTHTLFSQLGAPSNALSNST